MHSEARQNRNLVMEFPRTTLNSKLNIMAVNSPQTRVHETCGIVQRRNSDCQEMFNGGWSFSAPSPAGNRASRSRGAPHVPQPGKVFYSAGYLYARLFNGLRSDAA